ncbi:MAG: 50S ribosomal protein L5 [Bacteroidia bacterium]|nr:50S ribosomal protein L5 [Bacteroidia bacterium]MDW8089665.1 50S ribosomal protein L5 [Bacteroidia bacterium]
MTYVPNLYRLYRTQVIPQLKEKLGYKNVMQVPRLEKIVVSRGVGAAVSDKKLLEQAVEELALITGQRPVVTLSRKDVAGFKLRKRMPIGVKVTLRGARMYEFLERLIHVALPRTRDFRGLSPTGFDGRGNYTLGVREQLIFPEIDVDKVYKIAGMDITFVTSARTDWEALELLKALGMPFRDEPITKKQKA